MRAIRYPFQLSGTKKIQECLSYEDVVRCQVIDALMTNQGERVMRPRYGCDVQASLFDPTDELMRKDAASLLRRRLENLVTRALVREVKVEVGTEDPSAVLITVIYRTALYATDVALTVPVSSEYVRRQLETGVG